MKLKTLEATKDCRAMLFREIEADDLLNLKDSALAKAAKLINSQYLHHVARGQCRATDKESGKFKKSATHIYDVLEFLNLVEPERKERVTRASVLADAQRKAIADLAESLEKAMDRRVSGGQSWEDAIQAMFDWHGDVTKGWEYVLPDDQPDGEWFSNYAEDYLEFKESLTKGFQ